MLQSLIDAKSRGATFGALSDAELNMLKSSANKLAARAIYDDDKNIVAFRGSEESFKAEVDKLLEQTARAIELATGKKPSVKSSNLSRYE